MNVGGLCYFWEGSGGSSGNLMQDIKAGGVGKNSGWTAQNANQKAMATGKSNLRGGEGCDKRLLLNFTLIM